MDKPASIDATALAGREVFALKFAANRFGLALVDVFRRGSVERYLAPHAGD